MKCFFEFLKKLFRKSKEDARQTRILQTWTAALTEDAGLFNGLFSGLRRVSEGAARQPEAVLAEWWARARNRWHDISPEGLDSAAGEDCIKWAKLLLQAAAAAGITTQQEAELVLDENNAGDYTEWDGEALFPGDRVTVKRPAWYQNGHLLEKGDCKLK